MRLNYIGEEPAAGNHAGNKARRDVDEIFRRRNYVPIENVVETRFDSTVEKINYALKPSTWKKFLRLRRLENLNVIAQFPVYGNKLMRSALERFFDRNRMSFIVHDLNALRNFNSASTADELDRLNRAQILIVHNRRMRERLSEIGVRTPMIELECFDYLLDGELPARSTLERNKIIFAGNLAKSEFLRSIGELDVEFELYGPGFDEKISSRNVKYRGSFAPNEVPYKLGGGCGLIWDGDSLDECSGAYGEYLKLNNPHKLSLYIASGLPTVTWTRAAIAEFILEHGIGFTVGSLREIPSALERMTDGEYRSMLENSARLQSKLASGFFLNRALDRVEEFLSGAEKI